MLNTRKDDGESEFETWIRYNQDNSNYAAYAELFGAGLEATKDARFQKKMNLKMVLKLMSESQAQEDSQVLIPMKL